MPTQPERDELVDIGELKLHIVQWGNKGAPIICAHGLTANAYCFQALADSLHHDHRIFAYDLRGRGDSDKPEHGYSVPIHAEDLCRVIDTLGLDRPIVIGHSLGAVIALYFAAHYPTKLSKLVLMDAGAPLPWDRPEDQPVWLTASINRLGTQTASFDEYVQRLKLAPFLGPYWNDYCDLYFEHDVYYQHDGSVVAKCYRDGIFEETLNFDHARPETQWAGVQAPTLLLRAGQGLFSDNDHLLPISSALAAQSAIKNCRYINFPTLNHYTIIFGVESGPAEEIRTFLERE